MTSREGGVQATVTGKVGLKRQLPPNEGGGLQATVTLRTSPLGCRPCFMHRPIVDLGAGPLAQVGRAAC